MREFGRKCFKYTAYFNFDQSGDLAKEFENTKDPSRLLEILGLYTDVPLKAGETLIIFDEIQQSNKALNSLKYFCEEAPQYHLIAAGSLLGVALSKGDSFPVGKVEFLQMYPVSFKEFLREADEKIYDYVERIKEIGPLPEIVKNRLEENYRRYSVCGGMPAAVCALLEDKGVGAVNSELQDILLAYAMDFAKHAPGAQIPRITAVWESVPSQLAKENRKFVYKLVKPGARAREYEDALLWLQQAGLIYRVFCTSRPGLPLMAYDDVSAFKVYLFDTGLLRVMAGLPAEAIWEENPMYREFRGSLAENSVLEALVPQFEVMPRYWTSNGMAEVDFVVQDALKVIPAEVKAGNNTSGKSLSVYIKNFEPKISIVYSGKNMSFTNGVLYLPLSLACWTKKLVNLIGQ